MKKIILLLAYSFAITLTYGATVEWNNGGDGINWTDGANWNTGMVPTAADDVIIDGHTVILGATTTIQRVTILGSGQLTIGNSFTLNIAGYLVDDDGIEVNNSATIINDGSISITNTIGGSNADGLYIRGTFVNNGAINIDGTGDNGIYIQRGNLTNNIGATITITNTSQLASDGDGLYVDDSSGTFGLLTNHGTITITGVTGDDALYVNDGSSIDNHGMISISGNHDNGIRLDDGGIFNNMAGAIFNVDGCHDDQILVDNSNAVYNNSGTINLTNADGDDSGLYVIDAGTFMNMAGGAVNITGAQQFAIQIDANGSTAEIINNGTMTVMNSINDGLRLQEEGLFTNNPSGILNIISSNDEGISYDNNGTVNNNGVIEILNANDHGMEMSSVAVFNNNAGATFKITTPGDKGIVMGTGTTLSNSGTLDISGTVNEGIDMVDGTFNNNTGGVYLARAIGDDGLEINGPAILNNDGLLDIDGSGSEDIETFYGPAAEVPTINHTANATFTPGSSPGDLEIKGDFYLGAATITFEINGLTPITEFDQILNTSGSNFIDLGSSFAYLDWGSFIPAVGDKFKIIDGSGSTLGSFAGITGSNPDIEFTTTNLGAEIEIEITATLPIDLVRFSGESSKNGVQLSWQTASEINNEGFDIERYSNRNKWESIGYIKGNGTTTKLKNYVFLDKSPFDGMNYYRLKQNDFDGHFDYSKTIGIDFQKNKLELVISPNPVRDVLYINSNQDLENVEFQLYNSAGKLLWKNQGSVSQIPFEDYRHGVYYLEISTASERSIQKIIK